jgi:hypothetical protein
MAPDKAPNEGNPLEARYSNCVNVGFNAGEFVLDFGQFYSSENHPQYHTRIVTMPCYAKSLADTLRSTLEGYESTYGHIQMEDGEKLD